MSFLKYIIVLIIQFIGKLLCVKKSKYLDSDSIRSILVVRLDEIGDVVMISPLLHELRNSYPEANISLIVKPQVYNLVELCPYVNKIYIYERDVGILSYLTNIKKTYLFAKEYLWKENFDLAIVPRWDIDFYFASYVAFFSGSRRRIAYSEKISIKKSVINKGFDGFFTDVICNSKLMHEVKRNLYILEYLGGNISESNLEVWTSIEDKEWTENFLLEEKIIADNIKIAIFLSAGRKNKEWDVHNFIAVANRLAKLKKLEFILLGGGENTEKYGEIFVDGCEGISYNCIGKTTIRQTIEILKKCDFYFGGDTGPIHLAAACNMQGIGLFLNHVETSADGLDTPERFGPWKSDIMIIQPRKNLDGCEYGCMKPYAHCINEITIEEVYNKLSDLVKRKIQNDQS